MDPNSLNDLLSNPDTLNEMKNMMKDPNIMNQMNQMMSDPNMMSNIMNMMGGGLNPGANLNNSNDSNSEDNFDNEQDYQDKVGDLDLNGLNDLENVDIGRPIRETLYIENDNVLITNLNNKKYNNKPAVVLNFDKITNRYVVYILELDKHLSIKEENLKRVYSADAPSSDEDVIDNETINLEDNTN